MLQGMTVPDFGPERPGQASETRQMVERGRTGAEAPEISGRAFAVGLVIVLLAIAAFAVILRVL